MKPETERWVATAREDMDVADAAWGLGYPSSCLFHCQQAAEKLLKAAVTEQDVEPPKTHDLVELADLASVELTQEQRTFLTRLSDHAARSRYPGAEYNEVEVRELFQETKRFFEWLRAKLS